MGKPSGIKIGMDRNGPVLSVRRPSRLQDLIWDAVEEAVEMGATPKEFKQEVRSAWRETSKRKLERDLETLKAD